MEALQAEAVRVARTEVNVLLTGESGTGKELFARLIHVMSARAQCKFVAVNCAALSETLIESELFGHEQGAFTGAIEARAGLLEVADGATLLLDEVAELPVRLQAKLLRVLEQHTYRRVGGSDERETNLRILATMNQQPESAVARGLLREDLYYRLSVLMLHLPPLREHKEDIPLLAEHFLAAAHARHGGRVRGISGAALDAMLAYDWPGNVRELENAIEHAAIHGDAEDGHEVQPRHLPADVRSTFDPEGGIAAQESSLALGAAIHRVRQRYLVEALRRTGGNRSAAARLLGISRRAIYDLLAERRPEDMRG